MEPMRNSCGVRVTTHEAIADKEAWYMAWIVVVPAFLAQGTVRRRAL